MALLLANSIFLIENLAISRVGSMLRSTPIIISLSTGFVIFYAKLISKTFPSQPMATNRSRNICFSQQIVTCISINLSFNSFVYKAQFCLLKLPFSLSLQKKIHVKNTHCRIYCTADLHSWMLAITGLQKIQFLGFLFWVFSSLDLWHLSFFLGRFKCYTLMNVIYLLDWIWLLLCAEGGGQTSYSWQEINILLGVIEKPTNYRFVVNKTC